MASFQNDLVYERGTVNGHNRDLAILCPTDQQANSHYKLRDLPAPPKYHGDHAHLKAWKNLIKIKFTSNGAKLTKKNQKLSFIYGLLEGKAINQIQPYVLTTGINLADMTALLTILNQAFGDPDLSSSATRVLRTLKQKPNHYTYVPEYSCLAAGVC